MEKRNFRVLSILSQYEEELDWFTVDPPAPVARTILEETFRPPVFYNTQHPRGGTIV